jgi:predicted esterase
LQIVLGGFSQGGAVALYTALQLPFSLAGLCALSTYLPYGVEMSTRISEAAKKTPALLLHGLNDEVVGCGYSERTRDVLVSAGLQPQHKTYPYIGHSMDDRMLSDLAKFLKTVL